MAALFDAYIMVDWSAAAKPALGPNSIWIGVLMKDARLKLQFKAVNIDTRLKARAFIEDMVAKLTKRGDKVLLGFDFSLGYPAGTAKALGLELDARGFGMGQRSQRFALIADDGVVSQLFVEAPGEFRVSTAEHVLAAL